MNRINFFGTIWNYIMLDDEGYKNHPNCNPYWAKQERKLFEGIRPCVIGHDGVLFTIKDFYFKTRVASFYGEASDF